MTEKVLVTESYLEDIADAIRAKTGDSDTYKPSEMAEAIMGISGGGGTGAVRYDEAQTLTDAQKTTARGNIAAASADDVGALSSAMTYVISGNKSIETATIPVGSYVRLVGSTITGHSDGIYTVAKAIPVDTVIDGTYFNESAPIPGGLGGAVQQSMAAMSAQLINNNTANVSEIWSKTLYKVGRIVQMHVSLRTSAKINQNVFTIPDDYLPADSTCEFHVINSRNSRTAINLYKQNKVVEIDSPAADLAFTVVYISAT